MHSDLFREILRSSGVKPREDLGAEPDHTRLLARGAILGFKLREGAKLNEPEAKTTDTQPLQLPRRHEPLPPTQKKTIARSFDFPVAYVSHAETLVRPDSATVLKQYTPLPSDHRVSVGKLPKPQPLIESRVLSRLLQQCLAVELTGQRIDIPRLTQRVSRFASPEPLPRRRLRQYSQLAVCLIDNCPPLLNDQLRLCRWLQAQPVSLRPDFIARADGDDWLYASGNDWLPMGDDFPPVGSHVTGRVLCVGNQHQPSPPLQLWLQSHATYSFIDREYSTPLWLSPNPVDLPNGQLIDWDSQHSHYREPDAIDWLLALLWPLPQIRIALVRDLRRLLGVGTSAEIAFWDHDDTRLYPHHGWGDINYTKRSRYAGDLRDLNTNTDRLHACLDVIATHLQCEHPFHKAEVFMAYREHCPSWAAGHQRELRNLDDYIGSLGRTVSTDHGEQTACSLLEMAQRIGTSVTLTEPAASAVQAAQSYWRKTHPEIPALVGQTPLEGVRSEHCHTQVCFDGRAIWLRLTDPSAAGSLSLATTQVHTNGFSIIANVMVKEAGAVLEIDQRRQLLPVNERIDVSFLSARKIRIHGVDSVYQVTGASSNQFHWAESLTQNQHGLTLTTSQHLKIHFPAQLTHGPVPVFDTTDAPSWLKEATLRIDDFGLCATVTLFGVEQTLRWIPPGRFMMGSPDSEAGRDDDETQYEVLLSDGYWLMETPCTQELWKAVMDDNPSEFKGDMLPVEMVSWEMVESFLDKINKAHPALNLCLPTEAQWEYACRAGTQTPFWFGHEIDESLANIDGKFQRTTEVKRFAPNPWGLYDMHGNVWEWCHDWFGNYPTEPVLNPTGAESGERRVLRGGSWVNDALRCRSAYRNGLVPSLSYDYVGFRFAQVDQQTAAKRQPTGKDQEVTEQARRSRNSRDVSDGVLSKAKEWLRGDKP